VKWTLSEDVTPRGPCPDFEFDQLDNNTVVPLRELAEDAPERVQARAAIKKKRFTCNYPNFEGMFFS
jgi:hypothetical protein